MKKINKINNMIQLYDLIADRKNKLLQNSYTSSLFLAGIDKILQKIGEEATEVIIAGKNRSKERIIEESCDLIYHLFVLLAQKNITLDKLNEELAKRNNKK